jgi:BirA family biotin operon repressor/biotin-[acetyl-CoA-carboxylase] ligase
LRFWEGDIAGLAQKTVPEDCANLSPVWKHELQRYAPWRQKHFFLDKEGLQKTKYWLCSKDNETTEAMTVNLCGPCSSSLDVAWFLEKKGLLKDFDSVLAVSQWSGRGQFRRNWYSPPGNLYLAWALPSIAEKKWDRIISLLVGLALVRAWKYLGLSLKLKWPNDLVLERRKAGGILLEERRGRLLAGIGLNLYGAPDPDVLGDGHTLQATAFAEYTHISGPLTLWLDLVHRTVSCYLHLLGSEKLSNVLSQIESILAFKGEKVWVTAANELQYPARILGLDSCGGLLVSSQGREEVIDSGSISPCQ